MRTIILLLIIVMSISIFLPCSYAQVEGLYITQEQCEYMLKEQAKYIAQDAIYLLWIKNETLYILLDSETKRYPEKVKSFCDKLLFYAKEATEIKNLCLSYYDSNQ